MQSDIVRNENHGLFDAWAWPAGRAESPVLLGAALSYGDAADALDAYHSAGFAPSAAWRVLAERGGTGYNPMIVRGQRWVDVVTHHQAQRVAVARASHPVGHPWERVPGGDLKVNVARAAERLGLWTPDELSGLTPRAVCRRLALLTPNQRRAQLGLLATVGGWVEQERAA